MLVLRGLDHGCPLRRAELGQHRDLARDRADDRPAFDRSALFDRLAQIRSNLHFTNAQGVARHRLARRNTQHLGYDAVAFCCDLGIGDSRSAAKLLSRASLADHWLYRSSKLRPHWLYGLLQLGLHIQDASLQLNIILRCCGQALGDSNGLLLSLGRQNLKLTPGVEQRVGLDDLDRRACQIGFGDRRHKIPNRDFHRKA